MRTEAAQASAAIRKQLRKNGIKARVTSKTYSGGDSVRVTLPDDLLPAAVDEITTYCDQYQQGHFDGMFDIYENTNYRSDIPQVKFVFVDASFSDELVESAEQYVESRLNVEHFSADDLRRKVYQTLRGGNQYSDGFYFDRKPRQVAA
jgi:hypothetical protein